MGQGFFDLGPMPQMTSKPSVTKYQGCDACGLSHQGKKSPLFIGSDSAKILIIAEAPCEDYDESDLLNQLTHEKYTPFWEMESKRFSSDILKDCAIMFAIPCVPKYGAMGPELNANQAQMCNGRIFQAIEQLKPQVIVPMGIVSIEALLWSRMVGRISNIKASDLIGAAIPDRDLKCWVCPTYGMDYIHRQEDGYSPDRAPRMYFQAHMRRAWSVKNEKFMDLHVSNIKTSQDPTQIIKWINEALKDAREVSIDYETTGLKPHREGHRIVISSMAYWDQAGVVHAYGFRWFGDNPELVDAWEQLLQSTTIKKIAHKADFELIWSRFRSGPNNGKSPWMKGLGWDTCLGAHCLNNNGKVGLKLLSYTNLGVLGYDAAVDRFLKPRPGESEKYGNNAFNYLTGTQLPWGELMGYCAQDALYTLLLKGIQNDELAPDQRPGFDLFMRGVYCLAKTQSNGLPVSLPQVESAKVTISQKYAEAYQSVMSAPEVKLWTKGSFSPTSNKQLEELLYDVLKIDPPGGARNVQESTLSKIDIPFVKALLEMRRWIKIQEFMDGFVREMVWDDEAQSWLIRPNFNISSGADDKDGGPRTFRSSSDSPNFQNIPKRDVEATAILRSIFRLPAGWKWKEYDYKGVEVSGGACYHKDPNMIVYLTDPTTDMHRDTACDLFFRDKKTFLKCERKGAKNGYVFPTFYGATPKSMAPAMWDAMSPETRAHIAEVGHVDYWSKPFNRMVHLKGITTLEAWNEHVKQMDKKFWGERFPVYDQWRHEEWDHYQEIGYVTLYTGFRCYGPMGFTECANRRIQGTSFHILLQALIWVVEEMENQGFESLIVGQIHDAQIGVIKDDEESRVDEIIRKNGTQRIVEQWPWIIVPLTIEHDASKSGGTWAEMHSVGALTASTVLST